MNFLYRMARAFRWLPVPTIRRMVYGIVIVSVVAYSGTLFAMKSTPGEWEVEIGHATAGPTFGLLLGLVLALIFYLLARGLGLLRLRKRRTTAVWIGSIFYAVFYTLTLVWLPIILLGIAGMIFLGGAAAGLAFEGRALGFDLAFWVIGGGIFYMLAGDGPPLAAGPQTDVQVFA